MSEAKFTEGPWEVLFNGSWHEIRTTKDSGYVWVGDTCASSCSGDLELGQYNANLMASSPKMYKMLDEISDFLLETGGLANTKKAREIENLLKEVRGEK